MALTMGVEHAAAAARDDDDVDLGIRVELPQCGLHLAGNAIALHRGVHHAEAHRRPAQLGIAQHVFLGVAVFARDEADAAGKEGQALFAGVGEQPL
jgi:hypothetical protein